MKLLVALAAAGSTILAACSGRIDNVAAANEGMKSRMASDIMVNFDVPSERYFPLHTPSKDGSPSTYDFVCGRVTLHQRGGFINFDNARFIFPIADGVPGLADVEGEDADNPRAFDERWAERCPGYELARKASPGGTSSPSALR